MSTLWSPLVHDLVPYTPGEQPKGQRFVKLNTNENPYGPSPRVLNAIRAATNDDLRLYPDPTSSELAQAIADTHGLTADHVFLGNSSDEVLAHAVNGLFRGKGAILFPDITYSFYVTYCMLYEIAFRQVLLRSDFTIDPLDYVGPNGGIILANPNAPTGIALGLPAIEDILRRNPDVVVLVDEAYVDFGAESAASLIPRYDNLLVAQTFSKSRSLAGLHAGFAMGQPHLIAALRRIKDSFNSYPLDRLAQAGALAAWQDRDWFNLTRAKVMADRDRLAEGLRHAGFTVLPSATNFLLMSRPTRDAEDLLAGLRERGILVRHFRQPRIRDWLRISVGTAEECDQVLRELIDLADL
ncbi:pyridoxal phosphate-dependent aminotransferase [Falsirhodobacter halotolerans]|uniref:pyridoxal phosphate-dependent aminotransferase n=1 Tax=Falsirhodobacter halotolerans TaxID=1146892 RepID=UPI001FD4B1E9|nr:histidinol-phosphate transaminase [Falsirhodobacter halotolerans]MCJ8139964.1 histidinol-phosphate transaminase [Falsirhodobacter halotolerans]